jgi:hypothetical protein
MTRAVYRFVGYKVTETLPAVPRPRRTTAPPYHGPAVPRPRRTTAPPYDVG